jgi:hypothetical protein
MYQVADQLEEIAFQDRVSCRATAQRTKPPRRNSPRFEKRSTPGGHAGMHRRGTRG